MAEGEIPDEEMDRKLAAVPDPAGPVRQDVFNDESDMKMPAVEHQQPPPQQQQQPTEMEMSGPSGIVAPQEGNLGVPAVAASDLEQPPHVEEDFEDEPAMDERMEEDENPEMDSRQPAMMQMHPSEPEPAMLKKPPPAPAQEPAAPLMADPSMLKPPPPSPGPTAPDVEAPLMTEESHLKPPPPPQATETADSAMAPAAADEAAMSPAAAGPSADMAATPGSMDMDPDAAAKAAAAGPSTATQPGAVASQPGAVPLQGQDEIDKEKEIAGGGGPATDGVQKPRAEEGDDGKPQQPKATPKKKKEINKDFKDVQETGKWGTISKAEMYGVGGVVVLLVLIVIIVVAVVATRDRTKEENVPPATQAPTVAATSLPPEQVFEVLLTEWQENPVTSKVALINDPAYYQDTLTTGNCTETPMECAMSWALYQDEFPPPTDDIGARFALANLYYALGGSDWVDNTNWLSNTTYCDWHGVTCNRGRTQVEELDFEENGLAGELPLALALLSPISVLSLKDNQLRGTLPGEVFAGMPNLFVMYLQSNQFTGTIPDNLLDNEALALLFIQHNQFEGPFPEVYCSAGAARNMPVFSEFSLDCDRNPCPEKCCMPKNCFYDSTT